MELLNLKFFTVETMLIQFVILVIILYVLNKYIFKPYLSFLDKESEKRAKLEKDYKNIDKLISDANIEKDEILEKAREKSGEIVSHAQDLAKEKKNSIIEKAEMDAKSIIESSRAEIEKDKLSMLDGVKNKLIDLILKFNSKLFKDEKVSKEYIERELGNIK